MIYPKEMNTERGPFRKIKFIYMEIIIEDVLG